MWSHSVVAPVVTRKPQEEAKWSDDFWLEGQLSGKYSTMKEKMTFPTLSCTQTLSSWP